MDPRGAVGCEQAGVLLARQAAASWRQLPASWRAPSVDPSLLHSSCNLSLGSRPGAIDPLARWPLIRQAFAAAMGAAGCPGCPTICHQLLLAPQPARCRRLPFPGASEFGMGRVPCCVPHGGMLSLCALGRCCTAHSG